MSRFTEVYGVEGTAKTTFGTEAIIACQQGRGCLIDWVEKADKDGSPILVPEVTAEKLQPGLGILIDSEFKWPIDRGVRMGVDWERIKRIVPTTKTIKGKMVIQPLSLEFCLAELEKVLDKVSKNPYFQRPDVPVLVVWDSLAASPIEAEMEGDGLQEGIAAKARKVRAAMRRWTSLLAYLNVTVLIINQVYSRIGIPGVESSGGRGLKFHSSHRVELSKAYPHGKLMEGKEQVGIRVTAKAVKSSICPPTHNTQIPVRFDTGIDDDLALLEFFTSKVRKFDVNPITTARAHLKMIPPGEDQEAISFYSSGFTAFCDKYPGVREHLRSEVMRNLRR